MDSCYPNLMESFSEAGSPTEKMQKLCHLNLMEWRMHKQDVRVCMVGSILTIETSN